MKEVKNNSLQNLSTVTIFIGSFLLFGVQPMLGRTLLPSFGGTASVWVVCLCAYQVLLLAGYFYAYMISRASVRTQNFLHSVLLLLSVVWVFVFAWIRPALKNYIGNGSEPALEVLGCVMVFIGLPYILLSANSSLIQSWLSRLQGHKVYTLYAVSNVGSFFGLLFYPFLFEPRVPLTYQWAGFAVGLLLYATLLFLIGKRVVTQQSAQRVSATTEAVTVAPRRYAFLLWVLLPATSCFALNAVTTHITLDVMPLPLLWVVLLGAFLLSYVIGFSGGIARWMGVLEGVTLLILLLAIIMMNIPTGGERVFWGSLIAGIGLCLFACSFLHGWLYQMRPSSVYLTKFYFLNALGGALGGVAASIVAPLSFRWVAEYPVTLGLFAGLIILHRVIRPPDSAGKQMPAWLCTALFIGLILFSVRAVKEHHSDKVARPVYYNRGFFGTIMVGARDAKIGEAKGKVYDFVHGTTVHGVQLQIPGKERTPTAYFTHDSGGIAILQHPNYKRGKPMRVGVLGLGIGVLCAYSRTNDFYRCYEISPEALYCATNIFTFVKDSPAKIDLVLGDARKALEAEMRRKEEKFDVLYIDAFTGDNLPYHLSTREAFFLYFQRLNPDGILAVNISNWHLDLAPLMRSVSEAFDVPAVIIHQQGDMAKIRFGSGWAFFMRSPPEDFTFPPAAQFVDLSKVKHFKLPEDEFGSFISLIQW